MNKRQKIARTHFMNLINELSNELNVQNLQIKCQFGMYCGTLCIENAKKVYKGKEEKILKILRQFPEKIQFIIPSSSFDGEGTKKMNNVFEIAISFCELKNNSPYVHRLLSTEDGTIGDDL